MAILVVGCIVNIKSLSAMAPVSLPPGFRFHPTDEELVTYYLDRKINGRKIELDVIPAVDIYKCEPWDLPEKSFLPSRDLEWYFFSPRDRKYPNGSRTNRATRAGYWKATGKDRRVQSHGHATGMKKTLVYYSGRAPHGARTDWVMHEYRLIDFECEAASVLQDAYALCRVFKKSGPRPRIEETQGEPHEEAPYSSPDDYLMESETIPNNFYGPMELDGGKHEGHDPKFLPDTSSSDVTQVPHMDNYIMDDRRLPFARDEANSSTNVYSNYMDSPSPSTKARTLSECTTLEPRLPYPPLEVEDFPNMDPIDMILSKHRTIGEYMMDGKTRYYMNEENILEEILCVACASQEHSTTPTMKGCSPLNYPSILEEDYLHFDHTISFCDQVFESRSYKNSDESTKTKSWPNSVGLSNYEEKNLFFTNNVVPQSIDCKSEQRNNGFSQKEWEDKEVIKVQG